MGSAGGLSCPDRGAGEERPVGREDRGAAGAPRRGGAVPDAAPVLRGAVRVREDRDDGPGRRRGARRGVPGRLRVPGDAGRPGDRAAPEGARADLHRGVLAAHVRVAVVLPDPGHAHRRVRRGVGRVLIPDNASPIVADADAVNPRFTAGWLDYAQHCGFATDAARVRSPKDKPRVERAVQYVRGNFFAGEDFAGLSDAQARAEAWCRDVAGTRIHGTIQARPGEVFAAAEAGALLPLPDTAYDVPVLTRVKVHRDFHVEVARSLYSAPQAYLGRHLDARADSALVKLYCHGVLVKTHPRQEPGRRVTDPADLPAEKTTYAMRDVESLAAAARRHGDSIGIYAGRLLDTDLPWTKMRQVYRLLGLVRRYGPGPVDTACQRALDLDVVNVTKIASMLEKATEGTPLPPRPAAAAAARFARDPAEYRTGRQLELIPGGKQASQ